MHLLILFQLYPQKPCLLSGKPFKFDKITEFYPLSD